MSLTSSMEDYLEAVLVLQKQKGYARCVDVSEFLGVTKPSVSRAVKGGEIHERRNSHYLSCSGVRGVSWDGGVYRMYVFKRSLPALPEILQTFPSDASVFGIFPAPCRGSSV